jgi:hypothetical protein
VSAHGGYGHALYAEALSEAGEPVLLPESGGHLLLRPIPGTGLRDAAGCYPLFVCGNWRRLDDDFASIADRAVSVALVTDPFGDYAQAGLERIFDVVRPFKEHVIVDFRSDWRRSISKHHRYYARRALRAVNVDLVDGAAMLDDWMRLYDTLIDRHAIEDERRFSRASFEKQMQVPGLLAFAARAEGAVVAMHLWYVVGDAAYSHLLAIDAAGYEHMASYALHARALDHLAAIASRATLGAGAGMADRDTPLLRFKRGWSMQRQPVYFCGKVLQREAYDRLAAQGGRSYFPAYRHAP